MAEFLGDVPIVVNAGYLGFVRFTPLEPEPGDETVISTSLSRTITYDVRLVSVNQPFLALLYGLPLRALFPRGRAMRSAYRAKTRRRHRRR